MAVDSLARKIARSVLSSVDGSAAAASAQEAQGYRDETLEAATGVSEALEAAEGVVSLTTVIGRSVTPVTGNNNSVGTYAMGDPIPHTGTLTTIRVFGMSGGTLKIRRFTKSGNDFTQVGSDTNVVVAAGANTLTVAVAVNAGEYIGFYAPASAMAQTTALSDGLGWYFASGDQTSFTDATLTTNTVLQIGFDIVYYPVPAATLKTDNNTLSDLSGAFATTQTIGRAVTPVTGSNASASTYVMATPLTRASALQTVHLFCMVESQIRIRRFTKSGNDFTQVGSDTNLIARTGLNTFTLTDRMAFSAGEYVGFAVLTAGGVAAVTATADSNGWYSASGNQTTFTDATTTTSTQLQIGFDFATVSMNSSDFTSLSSTVSTQGTTLSDHTTALAAIDADLAQTETVTIGRSATPVTGSAAGANTYIFANPAIATSEIRTIRLFAVATGTLRVRRFTRSGDTFTQTGSDLTVTISSTGALTFSAPGDFTAFDVNEGEYVGYYAGSAVSAITDTADSGGWYSGAGNVTNFTDSTVNSTNQLQVGFDLVRTYYGAGGDVSNIEKVARSGLRLAFKYGYRNVNGQSNVAGASGESLSSAQTYNNLGFPAQASSPVATVTLTVDNTQQSTNGEWPGLGLAEYQWDLFVAENGISDDVADFQTITTNNGQGAQQIAYFLEGHASGNYTKVISQATATVAIGLGLGYDASEIGVIANHWIQGESYTSGYEDDLIALAESYDADQRAATGQAQRVPLFTYQTCTFNESADPPELSRQSALAQLAASRRSPLIYCVGPTYHLPLKDGGADYHHFSGEGLRELGAMHGLAEKRVVFDGKDWQPLQWTSFALIGSATLDLIFNAPEIVIDLTDTIVAPQPFYGFYVYDDTDTLIDEADVTISVVNRNRLRFALNTGSFAPGWSIKTGNEPAVDMGAFVGAATNVRDRMGDGLPQFYTRSMNRWCVIDDFNL